MLREVMLSILLATPIGIALVIVLLRLLWVGLRDWRTWRMLRKEDAADDETDAEWEEVVYR